MVFTAAATSCGRFPGMEAGIGGPYTLVLGTEGHQMLSGGDKQGYPLRKRILDIVHGGIRWSPVIKGGALVSTRGGDYELTVGQDFSIGYLGHEARKVTLYLTESFTFRVIEPAAAVALKTG